MLEILETFPTIRLRRLCQHPSLRKLIAEHQVSINDLVLPLFICSGNDIKNPIVSMPGHYQWSMDRLDEEIEAVTALKISVVILFGIPDRKDALSSTAFQTEGVIERAIQRIKVQAPQLLLIVDVCFCEYTNHGHCGVVVIKIVEVIMMSMMTKPIMNY
ncbi:hypothetical protein [Coxiella-like endosymbiont]|uniref:hypothetical protein n=1 Tax=Coxiella-like endosymbiont TaxID=1592897 RepID=UPI00272DA724|nr:hypothetical protein [Coxiella-like endosymbiont]